VGVPVTSNEFLDHLRASALLDEESLRDYLETLRDRNDLVDDPRFLASRFVSDGKLTTFQAQQLLLGRYRNFIVGRYKLLQPIGAGGMSKVFLCEHIDLRRRRAMKILTSRRAADPPMLARFIREARIVASLDHPNIVRAHDLDCRDGKIYYIIMDFVDGVGLNELVRQRGRIEPDHAANYVAQAACGLKHIHQAGLIHRDIKPGNLILDYQGVIKILDLGLARLQDDQEQITARFNDNSILGTADFIAPEQSLIKGEVDCRSDIYGLGATFYFMLTGQTPFGGATIAEKLLGHQSREPVPVEQLVPGLSPELKQIVNKMMAKSPQDRYQSTDQLLAALAPWFNMDAPAPRPNELPLMSRAAQGTSRLGMKHGEKGARFLAAARRAIGAAGASQSDRRPWRLRLTWRIVVLAVIALGAAAAVTALFR
jgi:serine/threonine protein kinase